MIRYGLIEQTPMGPIWVAVSDLGIVALDYCEDEEGMCSSAEAMSDEPAKRDQAAIANISQQLDEYFSGKELEFEVDIDWSQFSEFQTNVLQVVVRIPPGQVKTYGQIAEEIGLNKSAARAVGRANATNPIPIIIPCHRVDGANGELTGYGGPGGVKTKAWLLDIEGYETSHQLEMPFQIEESEKNTAN